LVVAGTFILAFGWFGFNPGSTLAGTDLRISFIVVNTFMLAGCVGSLAAMVTLMLKGLSPIRRCAAMACSPAWWRLRPLRLCESNKRGDHRGGGWLARGGRVFFFERRGIDDPSGRYPCMASTASGACCRSEFSPLVSTARVGTVWYATSL
jgi:hypothetical protein